MTAADDYRAQLAELTVGEPDRLDGRIELVDYDPTWPRIFARHAAQITAAVGDRAIRLEHVGSTSVPGLAAKPIIDIVLEVPDAADEAAYVPDLERAGYRLRIREPAWLQHRMCRTSDRACQVHVFGAGCTETGRMVRFRDWLRARPDDRDLYLATKRALAAREWAYVQQYADAKTTVIEAIMARAERAT